MPGLTKAQALALVQQGLAWRSDKSTEIYAMMDLVQSEELERATTCPWFLLLLDQSLSGTANTPTIAMPSDYWRHYDEGGVYYVTDEGPRRYLVKRPQDWIVPFVQDSVDGSIADDLDNGPMYYALMGSNIYVAPVPTANFTLYHNYYKHDTSIADTGTDAQNLWLANASSVLMNLTGLRMAEDLQHSEAMDKFQKRFAQANARLLAETIAREDADNEYVMGSLS